MTDWITGREAALRCKVNCQTITLAGAAGRILRRATGQTERHPLYVYDPDSLAAWIVEYRAERGMGPPPGTTTKQCLRCDEDFASEGVHNRLCPRCADSNVRRRSIVDDDYIYCDMGGAE